MFFHFVADLPVIETNGQNIFHDHNSVHLPNPNWEMTVSVRAERDASIVACERQDPFSSPCYWILLGGWQSSGYKSVIRRCPDRVNTDRDKKEICSQGAEAMKVSMNIKFELECETIVIYEHEDYIQKYFS
jgi:hypothetical protein